MEVKRGTTRRNLPDLCLLFLIAGVSVGPSAVADQPTADYQILQEIIPAPPQPEAKIGVLYTDPQRRIVMQYDLGRVQDDKVYFSNGQPILNIDDSEAYALANTPFLLEKFTAAHGLAQLPLHFDGSAQGKTMSLLTTRLSASSCQWPYDVSLRIAGGNKPPLDVMFLRRRRAPTKTTYKIWCEIGPGEVELTTHFEILVPLIYEDADGLPLIAFSAPASVFRLNETAKLIGPHLPGGIIVIPAELSGLLLKMVGESQITAQDAVNWFEGGLRTYGEY